MSYGKLVRDKIPEIIKANGEQPITRILTENEYKTELQKKLLEECNEVISSSKQERLEELADVLEVIIALAKLEEYTLDDILSIRNIKNEKRGGFEKRIYLEGIKEKG